MKNLAQLQQNVLRAVEIKATIADLEEELDEIRQELDAAGVDRLEYEGHAAVKVVQDRRLFSQAEACKILGPRAADCFYQKPSIFWKFN